MKNYSYFGYGKKLEFDRIKNPLKTKKGLSIVIPTYNEEGNVSEIVKKLEKVISKTMFKKDYEIIIVDDNSKDKTPKIIDDLANKGEIIALHRKKRGIFSAVTDGIEIANGEYILTMDSDFSHPPELIPKMLEEIKDQNIVIGSRYTKGGCMDSSLTRKWGGFFLNRICGIIIGTKVRDLGGNFRLFRKRDFSRIKFEYNCSFAEFGHELIYRAEKLGFRIKEVPFVYHDRKKGVSKIGNLPLKQAFHYLKRATQLRLE